MRSLPRNLQVPVTPFLDDSGKLSSQWESFFKELTAQVESQGTEKAFALSNNLGVAADIEGLSFSYKSVSQVSVDYLIQRVTTGGGATELIEKGQFFLAYRPTSNNWALTSGPTTSGITLTITAAGQVQYTSTNITGTNSISKITWKARTLAAKNSYSKAGK